MIKSLVDKQARERLRDFGPKLINLSDRINKLRSAENGDWVYKNSRLLFEVNKVVPSVVVKHINTMLRNGGATLEIERGGRRNR